MQLAIDSYTYHRFFGDWYAGLQSDPGERLTVFDFLDRACVHGVAGVSLESCFVPHDERFIEALRMALDARKLQRVWAWGHPNGLASGTDRDAAADLVRHLSIARRLGARVMRICGGGRRTRPASWMQHKRGLIELLRPCVEQAERHGVVMAIENHIDLLADEMVELIATVDSPWLGVCFDTANNLRMFEDPVEVAAKLAPFTRATHVKDVTAQRGDPRSFAFWPSVPLGQGLVDLRAILRLLRDAGYAGLLALEIDYLAPVFASEGEEACVAASIAWLRDELAALQAPSAAPWTATNR
ncbi:MAG TPA: sugar phosphate isomerase/epimerase family protein [Casimicrobiaceae bacterium]|nr:sugar phosphate isomerase/epimerase family protein [Casimicrobiaceae bacterium]